MATAPVSVPLPPATLPALPLLLRACEYARQLGRPLWDFAVEIDCLRAIGLTNNDLRWLLWQGYVVHVVDKTRRGAKRRRLVPVAGLALGPTSCFVLTADAEALARQLVRGEEDRVSPHGNAAARRGNNGRREKPAWDAAVRELRWRGRMVRKFRRSAPNQEYLLSAFQELGWPRRLDDPLPPNGDVDPEERVRETVRSLNRGQRPLAIRFESETSGRGIRWTEAT
jgi:hypothetical protein